MFGPPWGSDPFGLPAYLSRGAKNRRTSSGRWPEPPRSFPVPFFPPPPPMPYGMKPRSGPKSFHPEMPKLSKYARFSDHDTPPSSDFSTSEWDDPYTLDTDSDLSRIPGLLSRRRYPSRDSISRPNLSRVSIKLPSPMAQELKLRSDEIVLLPPLVHLHIKIRFYCRRDELRAAVPGSMAFEEVTKQVVRSYLGERLVYTARAEQRGWMREIAKDACLEDLAYQGEVWRGGRREMMVEIVVGGDEGWYGVRGRVGQGPGGGSRDAEVETTRKREVSRTRYARKG
ncbi:hypothetical protein E8E12_003353 [Didymella heteroderae]|uniref:Uncharacterized protein n=1 Tax=Didymella heteroderae TaxID=1769908 RepID=A0A9P4WPD0_9PLEO|nr:hypothetical protein E8E12_003353 [Didymella heteroderae]